MQKAIRIIAVVLVAVFLIALIGYNIANPPKPDHTPWNTAMTQGDMETAEHFFVMYTDIFCPYCNKFSLAVMAHQEEFEKEWLQDKKIFFEIRVTDMNYENGHSENSLPAGEGAYCAAKQNKFWDYYHNLLIKIWDDYYIRGIGVDKTAEHIPELASDYFYDAAEKGGLEMDSFKSCFDNHETRDELNKNTKKAHNYVSGVPQFYFDKFDYSGFAGTWNTDNDWEQAKMLFDAGLTTK